MQRKRPLSQVTENNVIDQKKVRSNDSLDAGIDQGLKKRAGTVCRILLRNFMCHSLLEVNLNSNINFITGRNGSGKSAILTALVIGLGAKASTTNRGNSIKNFIKEGKTSATIEITIYNAGCMAYKPAVFGNEIIVQRNFSISGSSAYRIKSATGKIVSSSVKEIQRIASALNIQVDNPICILNQDTARNFLSTGDPKQKFILFMRATRLEVLSNEYKNTVASKKTSLQLYKQKEQVYNELKARLKEMKKKVEAHGSIIKLKDKLTLFQTELAWAKVRDSEDELNNQVKIVEALNQKHDEINSNIHNKVQKLEEIKEKLGELHQQIVELKEAAEIQNRPLLDIQHSINELKQRYNEKRRDRHTFRYAIENKTKDRDALQREICNFTSNLSEVEQEKLERLRKTANLEEKIKQIQSVIETTGNDLFQMKNNNNRTENEERDLRRELEQINGQYNNVQENINALKSESSNNLLLYGTDMPHIIAAINASKHKFSQMPKGPLGSYINIKDKKWAVAVEGYLGQGLLQSFAVDNRKDNILLMEIFNKYWRHGSKPMIITSKFFHQVHDISRNLVQSPSDCISIYDAVDISDAVVTNCIIDHSGIESVLLIPSNERAIELMSASAKVPRNCKQARTIEGDIYYPSPNYKTYGSRYKRARYLQVNTLDLISQYDEQMQELLQKRQAVESQLKALHKDKLDQQTKVTETASKLNKLKQAYSVVKVNLEELKATVEPEAVNIRSLESEMIEVKQSITQMNVNLERVEQEMNEIKESIAENEERFNKLQETSRVFEDRIEPLERQIIEQGAKKRDLNVNDSFEKKRLAECKNRLQMAHSKMLEKQKIVDQETLIANEVGKRSEDIREVSVIVEHINDTQRNIRKLENDLERPEETKRKYDELRQKYQQTSEVMVALHNNIEHLQRAVASRSKHYKSTEDYFITFLNHSFGKILEFRQFKGNLEIDMAEKRLNLIVIPQQGSQGHTVTANLSGGEKSFSTVAFLYALWQCMDFPFYFLDEFDVFMDTVNRSRVMEILIHHAKSKPDLQFVFLTPQGVSCIKDDSVVIHRLEDPERRKV